MFVGKMAPPLPPSPPSGKVLAEMCRTWVSSPRHVCVCVGWNSGELKGIRDGSEPRTLNYVPGRRLVKCH